MKWELTSSGKSYSRAKELLAAGWEPFQVIFDSHFVPSTIDQTSFSIWFKRRVDESNETDTPEPLHYADYQ